jgi:hypothetical protein
MREPPGSMRTGLLSSDLTMIFAVLPTSQLARKTLRRLD